MSALIGIVGLAGSGKDTVAGMVPGAKRFSFADPLKEFCAQVYGWSREQLWGPSGLRNVPDKRYPRGECDCFGGETEMCEPCPVDGCIDGVLYLTPRYALQTLGTDWGRDCYVNTWVDYGIRRAQEWLEGYCDTCHGDRQIDCNDTEFVPCPACLARVAVFPDCRFVNEAQAIRNAGGEVWFIDRPGAGLQGAAGQHVSEQELTSAPMLDLCTKTILNSGTLDDLRELVKAALR